MHTGQGKVLFGEGEKSVTWTFGGASEADKSILVISLCRLD